MWLSVFIVFSLVVFIWIQSFQQKLTFLINPGQERAGAGEQESPLSVIGGSFNDLKAAISDLFGLTRGPEKQSQESTDNLESSDIKPRLLPVSE